MTDETIPLPEPAFWGYHKLCSGSVLTSIKPTQPGVAVPVFTADQVRVAVMQERRRCAELAWPELPNIKLWSREESIAMLEAENRAEEEGKGHYETMFAIAAAALKICAAAIRSGHSITETTRAEE